MKQRKICCFCESWESGGIESLLHNLLLRMDLTNMEVDIVAACVKKSVFTAGLEAKGIRFVALSGQLRNLFSNHRRFRQLLRERRYDAIHFNLYQGLSLYYARIAQEEGIPVRIVHSHNNALRKSPTRCFKLLLHRAGSHLFTNAATDLWACSEAAAKFLFPKRQLDRSGFRFIPNGIDTARFTFDPAARERMRTELGLGNSFVMGNVGRLCYQKNQNFLLDIFAEVLKTRPDSHLLLVGEGEDRPSLEAKAARLGIADRVIFCGTSNHVEQLMWSMDAFIFPSLFEGLGIVAIEAQAAGLPVICSGQIPPEANVTPLFHTLPLDAGASTWAKTALNLQTSERQAFASLISDVGFDVSDVAGQIEATYRGK